MFKVIASDKLSDKGLDILKSCSEIELNSCPGIVPEELGAIIGDCDALLIRSGTTVTADLIEKAKQLKLIGRAGVGVDNVDIEAASKRGIIVMNTPDGNTITTAEHTISMLMSLAREIPAAASSMRARKWEKKKFMGAELNEKVLGIIGLGRIGSAIAARAKGLGMQVVAYEKFAPDSVFEELGAKKVELDELFRTSDFITVHTPLTPETKHIINKEAFAKMKNGVRIINCARGGIVSEEDLLNAIKEGIVAGAALDVFETEPPTPDNPLLELDEVICTPHLGASTREAQENVSVNIAEQTIDYLLDGVVANSVNVPSVTKEASATIEPFKVLAEKVGSLAAQLAKGNIKKVSLKYYVDNPAFPYSVLKSFLLQGILGVVSDVEPNWISASGLAKDMGIVFDEEKLPSSADYANLVQCTIETNTAECLVSGAVVCNNSRIVQIEEFAVEMVPDGHTLIFYNNDKPAIVGNIGRFLGEHKVNINNMLFGRESVGGDAITIFGIDTALSDEMLLALSKFPDIQRAAQVKL